MSDHKELIAKVRSLHKAMKGQGYTNIEALTDIADALEAAQPRQIDRVALASRVDAYAQREGLTPRGVIQAAIRLTIESLSASPAPGEVGKNRDERDAKYFHDGWIAALREVRLRGDRKVGEFLIEQLGVQS